MLRKNTYLLPCIAALFALTVSVARASSTGYRTRYPLPVPSVPGSLGVNIHFTTPAPGEMKLLAAEGFKWIRMDFSWQGTEQVKGKYNFTAYKTLMGWLQRYSIRPIFILDYGNDLYQKGAPTSAEARAAFSRWAAAAVAAFRGEGVLWEMWNEPNGGFWPPQANVQQYADLALAASQAIRRTSPTEWLIGPGMSGMDFSFLRECFQRGLLKYWDAVSFHPYRLSPPETATDDFAQVRALIAQYAPSGKHIPLLSSEWGYSVAYPGLNIERQARFAPREFLANMASGLRLSIWYDWHDDGLDPKNAEHNFGTVFNDYRLKPDYIAISTLAKYLRDFQYNKRIWLGSPDDYCLLFSKGTQQRLALWTTSTISHDVTVPMSSDPLRLVWMNGQSRQASAGNGTFVVKISHEPEYIIPEGPNDLLAAAAAWHSLPACTLYSPNTDIARVIAPTFTAVPFLVGALPHHAVVTTKIVQPTSTSPLLTVRKALAGKTPRLNGIYHLQSSSSSHAVLLTVLQIGGAAVEQTSQLTSIAPLTLAVLPPSGRSLAVQVTNRSGFTGPVTVALYTDGGVQKRAIRLTAVKQLVTVRFTAPKQESVRAIIVEGVGKHEKDIHLLGNDIVNTGTVTFKQLPLFTDIARQESLTQAGWNAVPDGDPAIKSTITSKVVQAPAGLPSNSSFAGEIRYKFDVGWKFLRVSPGKPLLLSGKPESLGLWVFGDGSGNGLRMRFTDNTNQTFQAGAGNLTWVGWRFVEFKLSGDNGHWGGANDGQIHYPLRIDSLLLIDGLGRATSGHVWFSDPWLIYARSDGR